MINDEAFLTRIDEETEESLPDSKEELNRMKGDLRLLKKAIETIQLGVTITDLQRKIIFSNPADAVMHGYTPEELVGKESRIFGLPEKSSGLKKIDPQKYKSWKRETVNVKKNGSIFPVELISDIVTDQDGNPTAIITCCLDITKRKEAEKALQKAREQLEKRVVERTARLIQTNESFRKEIAERRKIENALRASEERYRNIVESSPNAIIIQSRGKLVYVNPEAITILGGKSKEDFIGRPVRDILHPDYYLVDKKRIQNIYKKKSAAHLTEEKFVRLDGKVIDVEVAGIRIDFQGEAAVLSTAIDITKAKLAAEKEKIHQQQLMQADKMVALGTLVSGVAHEINNPNNFIMLNAEIFSEVWESLTPILDQYYQTNKDFVLSGFPYKKARKRIGKLIKGLLEGAQRIKSIVNELKDFARPEAPESFQKIDVNKVVNSAISLTKHMIKRSTPYFHLQLTEDIPKVIGGFQRLEQVFINLIQNACQAVADTIGKPPGSIVISTMYDSQANDVVVIVKDEGEGIPEETMRFITDPFFTTKRHTGGTGLGLSVSLRIIQDHSGTLTFKSKTNQGTEAIVRLPAEPRKGGDSL